MSTDDKIKEFLKNYYLQRGEELENHPDNPDELNELLTSSWEKVINGEEVSKLIDEMVLDKLTKEEKEVYLQFLTTISEKLDNIYQDLIEQIILLTTVEAVNPDNDVPLNKDKKVIH